MKTKDSLKSTKNSLCNPEINTGIDFFQSWNPGSIAKMVQGCNPYLNKGIKHTCTFNMIFCCHNHKLLQKVEMKQESSFHVSVDIVIATNEGCPSTKSWAVDAQTHSFSSSVQTAIWSLLRHQQLVCISWRYTVTLHSERLGTTN